MLETLFQGEKCRCRQPHVRCPAPTNRPCCRLQGRYLRSVVQDATLWKPHVLERWPGADAELLYGGDWARLYHTRASLPPAFPTAADKARRLTTYAQMFVAAGKVQPNTALAFEEVMRCVYAAGRARARCEGLKGRARGGCQQLHERTAERPTSDLT